MTITPITAVLVASLGLLYVTLKGLVDQELRARLEDLPAALIWLVLRIVPSDSRDDYRADWVDNLLVAFNQKNARYPISRLFRALVFVGPLFWTASSMRLRSWSVKRARKQAAKLDRDVRVRISLFRTIRTDLSDVRIVHFDDNGHITEMMTGRQLMQPMMDRFFLSRRLRRQVRKKSGAELQRLNRHNRWVRM